MPADDVTTRPVGGRYELRALLGRGGMGSVWRAEDLLLQRPVAVKKVELPPHLPGADRESLRQRVLREARAAARVSHPRLVTIFDVVEEEGLVFLVQELVDAPTLKALVGERGPLPPAQVAAIGHQLVDGLAAAHRNGVIHRDVKPSNVMVLPDGGVKLTDFGVASVHGDPSITATGMVIGSPAYMAPEQATGATVGPAADLWSLGATLYFAVEGEAPFGRADTLSTLTAVVNEPPRTMTLAGPLAPLLSRLLDKSPEQRPGAAEVGPILGAVETQELRPTLVGDGADVTRAQSPKHTKASAPVTRARPAPAAVTVREPPPPARSRWLGVTTAIILLLLVGGLALAASLADDGDQTPTAGPARQAEESGTEEPATTSEPQDRAEPTTSAPPGAEAPNDEGPSKASVPDGWSSYTDPKTGYTLAYPPGWQVQARDGTRTDFTEPSTGTYLRVDWTDEPGPSAQADWERQSKDFGARHSGYREIRIEPTQFQGSDNASLWEYSYSAGGATLHAYNLGFVLGDDYGFALNFQTREENWAPAQKLWEQLKAGFRSPPPDRD